MLSFLVLGLVTGSIYAVTASGLVVTYTTTGIFNFAHGAVGMVMAFAFWELSVNQGVPVVLSLLIVLGVIAPLLGALVERLMMRNLHGATTGTALVVTLGLLLMLLGLVNTIWKPTVVRVLPPFFAGRSVSIFSVNVTYEDLCVMGAAVLVAVFLRLFFYRTRTGVAMRAVVDDPELLSLTGAPSGRVAAYSWMIGSMLAGLAGIFIAPQSNMNPQTITLLVINGYAAAMVGRLRSLPLTFLGAMILGLANSFGIGYLPSSIRSDVVLASPMILLFIVLLVLPEARLSIARVVRLRPPKVAGLRQSLVGAGAFVLVTWLVIGRLSGSNLATVGTGIAIGLAMLSLVLLSGYGGQVSLAQLSFLGLGAFAMAKVGHGHSILGVLAAIGLCTAAGAVISIPALRLRGLYLALATLAFAEAMDNVFFTKSSVLGSGGTLAVGRPHMFGFDFGSDRSFILLLAVVFAVCAVGVLALRRGAFGRRLVGMSDSPTACSTLGLDLTVTKLIVFSLSAGLAGLAGALYGGLRVSVTANDFQLLASLVLFLLITQAGISTVSGALFGGLLFAIYPVLGAHIHWLQNFSYLLVGLGAISIGRNPNGAVGQTLDSVATIRRRWTRQPTGGAASVVGGKVGELDSAAH